MSGLFPVLCPFPDPLGQLRIHAVDGLVKQLHLYRRGIEARLENVPCHLGSGLPQLHRLLQFLAGRPSRLFRRPFHGFRSRWGCGFVLVRRWSGRRAARHGRFGQAQP